MADAGEPIVVVGAGPAGCIAAALLGRGGADVLLVDDGRPASDRVELLPPGAVAAFRQAGLGEALDDPTVATRCLGVIRADGRSIEDFTASPGGRGLAVYRPSLDVTLMALARVAGAKVRRARLVGLEGATGPTLALRAGGASERIAAACVIDATGRAAAAARRRGARTTVFQKLAATRLPPGEDPGAWLAIDHNDGGWDYSLRGPGRRVDRWCVRTGARDLGAGGWTVDASARSTVPAAGPGWVAIGDASAAFDPICCQGLAHAAATAIVVAGIILANGTAPDDDAHRYDAACRATAGSTEAARRRIYAGIATERRTEGEAGFRTMEGDCECALPACSSPLEP